MINKKKVSGMTAAGWMIIIAIVLFFMFLAIKLIPAYIEFSNVKGVVNSTASMNLSNVSLPEIKEKFETKVGFARLENLITKDVYAVKQDKNGKHLIVDYDKKIPMFGNISVLIEFEYKQKL